MTEAVNGLFGVPDGEEGRLTAALRQGADHVELKGVCVLKLIHQNVTEGLLQPTSPQRLQGVKDHVGEGQEAAPPLHRIPKSPGRGAEPQQHSVQLPLRLRNGGTERRRYRRPVRFAILPCAERCPQETLDLFEEPGVAPF